MILPIATDVSARGPSVCPSVCVTHTMHQYPAKAVGQNKMPFGGDIRQAPRNIIIDGAPVNYGKGSFGVGSPNRRDQSAAANRKHFY